MLMASKFVLYLDRGCSAGDHRMFAQLVNLGCARIFTGGCLVSTPRHGDKKVASLYLMLELRRLPNCLPLTPTRTVGIIPRDRNLTYPGASSKEN